ncbi:MAG TPA: Gfo/Idh/MocA family oxidoreductase [Roseiflexaceae bacterium]|nr:Gfo/Idh/MocA family oxidoreductase [Roseiflexaceae bacterium]HMP39633.1 Gfo/Idh/MocA family oxidoreductase [Roseiflexaceae bacterium]
MTTPIRWGIVSTGRIAGVFATGLAALPDAHLLAVGSRSAESAAAFADRFGIPRRYASYEELAADPDIDAVYIATPHSSHAAEAIRFIRAGKAVLCEKPFTINAGEAELVVAEARSRGIFLMEAMWTRFLPALVRVREIIASGAIGDLRMLYADFGFRTNVNPQSRLFDPALGGGGLLDVGVYCISLASMLFGTPTELKSLANLGETGVDEQAAILLGHSGGRMALLSTATRTSTPHEATIMGTEGMIRIPSQWWAANRLTVTIGGNTEEISMPFEGNGYNYEAAEVANCLRAGKTESTLMPLDETLAIMRTMDTLRSQWGLRYPME